MKTTRRKTSSYATILAAMMTLTGQPVTVLAADTNAPASTPINSPASAAAAAPVSDNWVNVSASFTQQLGADNLTPAYLCRCVGLIVAPTGDILMLTAKQGVCISKDQGATWSVVPDNNVKGRCENSLGISIAYPYDGRMAYYAFDGGGGMAGGMSLDGGLTWKPFAQNHRGLHYADIDWIAHDPQTVFGVTHEPFYTLLSTDAGKTWQPIYGDETGSRDAFNYKVGVFDAKTLLRANASVRGSRAKDPAGLIELSTDAGQTWTPVANFQVQGYFPVHYGKNLYWTTTQGVITSPNGKDWTLTGPGAEGAIYGPYFGASEQEFVVVTDSNFLKTEDGGKTWKPIAKFYKAPDIYKNLASYAYFGWDSKHNILYASGVAASIYQLKL